MYLQNRQPILARVPQAHCHINRGSYHSYTMCRCGLGCLLNTAPPLLSPLHKIAPVLAAVTAGVNIRRRRHGSCVKVCK